MKGKLSSGIKSFFAGLVALAGASLVGWQGVLIYYLITGRVEAGEEHPPLILAIGILLIGAFLLAAGFFVAKPRASATGPDK